MTELSEFSAWQRGGSCARYRARSRELQVGRRLKQGKPMQLLRNLRYVTDVDAEIARRAIRAIGKIAVPGLSRLRATVVHVGLPSPEKMLRIRANTDSGACAFNLRNDRQFLDESVGVGHRLCPATQPPLDNCPDEPAHHLMLRYTSSCDALQVEL